jgi:hypothetical protein
MNDDHIASVAQLDELVKFTRQANFKNNESKEVVYKWISDTLGKFRYFSEKKKNKNIIKTYIKTMTGYSDSQVDVLIKRKKITSCIVLKKRTQNSFERFYTVEDIGLLADVNDLYQGQNGAALKKVLQDMYVKYCDNRFERLSKISVSHLYNLKRTRIFQSKSLMYTKTQAVSVPIGERRKPDPEGKPGYIRVDTVHQGDMDGSKGVYHVNLVDEVTQCEVVVATEKIGEYFMERVYKEALDSFPYKIQNFHSDNGGENINSIVAKLLKKIHVTQTKSRSRKCNDNALVEGKNGAVIRKHFGKMHIQQKHASKINVFNRKHFNPFINYHRPCAFPTKSQLSTGKIKITYEQGNYMTPIEKFLSLDNPQQYLKKGITCAMLKKQLDAQTHLEAATEMQEAKKKLFNSFNHKSQK